MRKTSPDARLTVTTPQATVAKRADAPDKKRRRRTPYPHLFRLLHWLLAPSLVVAALSGLSLHAAARPGWSLFSGILPAWFWQGKVQVIHLSVALVFVPSLAAVLWLYGRRKVRRRTTHVALLAGGLAMVLSGLLLLSPVGPPWVYWAVRLTHALSGLVVLPIALVWHAVDGLGRFRRALVAAFHPWASPRWRQVVYFLPVPLVTASLILNVWPASLAGRELVAKRVAAKANLQTLPWDEASPLEIELADGVGFSGGRTSVTLRALHDGNELFLQAEWLDPSENRRLKPWQKTAEGWCHLLTSPDDESVYYEDKFALIFPTEPDWGFSRFGCAAYCHLGGGRPYGYKGSDTIVDVWHWKAVRTDPVGQADDKHWLGFDFSAKDVGRHGDPKQGGGYVYNVSEDESRPAFLPDDLSTIYEGNLPEEDAVPYSPEAAEKIAVAAMIPGVITAAFVGDRGHVRCESQYEDGRWRLWLRRRLDTGSPYDRQFLPGGSYPFGCAAFDHTSNRHAYGLSAYRLTLEE